MRHPVTLQRLALARSAVDRVAHRRRDDAWLAAAWADPATQAFPVGAGRVLVEFQSATGTAGSGSRALPAFGAADRPRLWTLPAGQAPQGRRYLLGVGADGVAHFAVGVDTLPPRVDAGGSVPYGLVEVGLREVGALLGDLEVGLLVNAIGLDNWHRTHTHCSRCGAPTEVVAAGHVRRCPVDDSEHFPRTDPAVIMTVVDSADRLLLGHQAVWPPGRFSTLAGFVEPGEALEHAVAREVREETGIEIRRATYLGSQPWPFPSSLMLGFRAEAATTDITTTDDEIAEARWFRRDDIAPAIASGELLLPPRVSIARHLIEDWYGGTIADGARGWR